MPYRHWSWVSGLILAGLLLSGCGPRRTARLPAAVPVNGAAASRARTDTSIGDIAQAHAHYAAGVVREVDEDQEGALEEFSRAAFADLDDNWLVLEVTRRLIKANRLDKAQEILVRAAARPGASGEVCARLGLVYAKLGKGELAAEANRRAIKRAPESLAGYQNLFVSLLQNKQVDEAVKVLDQAAAQPKVSEEFLVGLAELYSGMVLQAPTQKEALVSKAKAVLIRAQKLNPVAPSTRLKLADAFLSVGDSERAAQLYVQALKNLPDQPLIRERVHARLADIYLRSSDHKRAAEQLEALAHEDPTNPLAYYYLGGLAYEDRKPAEAVDFFRKTVLLSPDFEQAYYDLALAQIGANKAGDALATLNTARSKFRQNFVMEFWTGLAYAQQKAYKQALQHLTAAEVVAKATEPERLTAPFYFQMGSASERLGDIDQAEKYFEKCLQVDPNFDEAMNYLGYMWAERGKNLERARELIEKAVKAEPKNAAYLDSLGWVQFKLNQPKEALANVLKAVGFSIEPDPSLFDHLGDIYSALNEMEKAREAYKKSLAIEDNPEIRRKLEKLKGR